MEKALPDLEKYAVVGTGMMGQGIACVLSSSSLNVIIKDKIRPPQFKKTAEKVFLPAEWKKREYRRKNIKNPLIVYTTDYVLLREAKIVIETVTEDIEIKKNVLREISEAVGKDCLIATNTSTCPLSRLRESIKDPARFLGMHFLYPPEKMNLVEIVRHKDTAEDAVREAVAFVESLGKRAIVVNDSPGFLLNRIIVPYLSEIVDFCLIEEGLGIEEVDKMMIDFGLPVGPATLVDLFGIKICYTVARAVAENLRSPRLHVSPFVLKVYAAHCQGRYACMYLYEKNKKIPNDSLYEILGRKTASRAMPLEHYAERAVYRIINEAGWCLEEGVVSSPDKVDLALSLGLGFPYGGPLRYADSIGIPRIVQTLDDFKERYGERFTCSPLLRKMAEQGRKFYI